MRSPALVVALAAAVRSVPCFHFKGGVSSGVGKAHRPLHSLHGQQCACCQLEYSADYRPWTVERRAPELSVRRSCLAAADCDALSDERGAPSSECVYDGAKALFRFDRDGAQAVSVSCLCNTPGCNASIRDLAG